MIHSQLYQQNGAAGKQLSVEDNLHDFSGHKTTLSVSCSRGTTPMYFPLQSSSFHKRFSTKLMLNIIIIINNVVT